MGSPGYNLCWTIITTSTDLLEKSKEILKDTHSSLLGSWYLSSWNYRIINQIDRVTAPILNYFLTSTPLDSYHLFLSLYSLYITKTTKKSQWIKWFRQSYQKCYKSIKKVEKKGWHWCVIKPNYKKTDCVDINIDFLAARLKVH